MLFIVNPSSGRVRQLWPGVRRLLEELGVTVDVVETEHPGHGRDLAIQGLARGESDIVSVGGDGTLNEVVNGLLADRERSRQANLGVIPLGSGNDFVRTAHPGRSLEGMCRGLAQPQTRAIDAGVIRGTWEGEPVSRYFINVASTGFTATVCQRVHDLRSRRAVNYYRALIAAAVTFRNQYCRVEVDGEPFEGRFNSIAVGNGAYFGDGFRVCPTAHLADGKLDIVMLEDFSRLETLVHAPSVRSGRHLGLAKVKALQGRHIHIECPEEPCLIQAEGELAAWAPLDISVVPAAVNLMI